MFERTKFYVREHASQIAIMGIMAAVTVGIAVAIGTNDISEVLARTRR